MNNYETILSVLLGISLAAAVGFRIFVPLLIMSLANMGGLLSLSSNFEWIGTLPALVIFSIATIIELGGYFFPIIDNFLDMIAGPIAVIAGTIAMASTIAEFDPLIKWTLALIAGGGTAGLVQGLTTITRGTSTLTTGGLGNHAISIGEAGASLGISILALFFPIVIGILTIIFLIWAAKKVIQKVLLKRA